MANKAHDSPPSATETPTEICSSPLCTATLSMNMDRVEALNQLVRFGDKREFAYSALASLPLDNEVELVKVTKEDLANVLNKFLLNEITADDLELWANFIECRNDLNYAEIEDYIYALANPVLVGEIDVIKINKMIQLLNGS